MPFKATTNRLRFEEVLGVLEELVERVERRERINGMQWGDLSSTIPEPVLVGGVAFADMLADEDAIVRKANSEYICLLSTQ